MRITFPNPLGPPITFDTARLPAVPSVRPLLAGYAPVGSQAGGGGLMGGMSASGGGGGGAGSGSGSARSPFRRTPLRVLAILAVVLLVATLRPALPLPPSYADEWATERALTGGEKGRYVRLQHHLAVLGDRSYAFEPYVQDETWLPFEWSRWPWRSARIPLSAFVATVINGFEEQYNHPRAVPAKYFDRVCPLSKQRVYTLRTEDNPEGDLDLVAEGQARIHQLQVLLAGSDDGCIRIRGEVFDDEFFDSRAPLDTIDTVIHSPVLAHFTFSPLVLSILNRMLPHLAPDASPYDLARVAHTTSAVPLRTPVWKHVLALHLRRGDGWQATCDEKGARAAPLVGWNKLPNLPGNENVPPPADMVAATRLGMYRAKCDPSVLEIIARARRMRKNHPLLRAVYILTDADAAWADEMRMWMASEGWDKVFVGNQDLYGDDDAEVGVAVDMEVARRAGVFVGNGFSTTSSNIVLLRTRDGIHPDLTQFW
ncbi:hypothetical protein Q5752_004287 [Cryptotrichosporon argae]